MRCICIIVFSAGCCTLRTHFSAMCRIGSGLAAGLIYITRATADSFRVACGCFGCRRKLWSNRLNWIKPAAHQLTILTLRRPCIGFHSCRHCALSYKRQMKGCTHPQPTVLTCTDTVQMLVEWIKCFHGHRTLGPRWKVGIVSIFDWSACPSALILDWRGVLYPNN